MKNRTKQYRMSEQFEKDIAAMGEKMLDAAKVFDFEKVAFKNTYGEKTEIAELNLKEIKYVINKHKYMAKKSRFANEAEAAKMSKGFYEFTENEPVVFENLVKSEMVQKGVTQDVFKADIEGEPDEHWSFPTHSELMGKLRKIQEVGADVFEITFLGKEKHPGDSTKTIARYSVKY